MQIAFALLINGHDRLMGAFGVSIYSAINGHFGLRVSTPNQALLYLLYYPMIWYLLQNTLRIKEFSKGEGYRFSLVPGYEIDRVAILQIMTRTQSLVRSINPKP